MRAPLILMNICVKISLTNQLTIIFTNLNDWFSLKATLQAKVRITNQLGCRANNFCGYVFIITNKKASKNKSTRFMILIVKN